MMNFARKWMTTLSFLLYLKKAAKTTLVIMSMSKAGSRQDKLDKNGHLTVDHDLHNHDGELPDGIAEAFIEWAKSEALSFWKS